MSHQNEQGTVDLGTSNTQLESNFWSRVHYHVEGTFSLLLSDVIQISLRSKRFQSSYSFFALVPTFSTNSRGKAWYAVYMQFNKNTLKINSILTDKRT